VLWHVCVKHILDRVPALCGGQQSFPRVWWIRCGLASSMPFHAAGNHTDGSQDNVLSRVISSYTPLIKALGYARSKIKQTLNEPPMQDQMFITLMPETPQGASGETCSNTLRGVFAEKEEIVKVVSPHMHLVIHTTHNTSDVLDQLENCQISYFACHGKSSLTDPSSSCLVLQRLAPDGTLEIGYLSVHRISQLRLGHAKIAYLSACSTAENQGERLQDEVIHIVSGF
jgi:CHAT domain-containing protein